MRYADAIRDFIPKYLRNATVLTTPHALYTAWLHRQTMMIEEGIEFNDDCVLAVNTYKVYNRVEKELIESGEIVRIFVNYNDVAIAIYGPRGTTVAIKTQRN